MEYYEQLYADDFDNLDDMDELFEKDTKTETPTKTNRFYENGLYILKKFNRYRLQYCKLVTICNQ